jgi:hypothetical protein
MPANNPYQPGAWRTELFIDLLVPSGQLCQVRRVGPVGLIKAGLFEHLDFLGAAVGDHIAAAEEQTLPPSQRTPRSQNVAPEEALRIFQEHPEQITNSLDLIGRVMELVVVQPKVVRPVVRDDHGQPRLNAQGEEIPLADEAREPDVVYTDYIDMMDQMFIFQFVVGGTRDLETFRQEYGDVLAGLESR